MEIYLIEGSANTGKSSLILAQFRRLMKTGKYILVENENPHSLDDFRFLIEEKNTEQCILFNSPTDDKKCIKGLDAFINKCNRYNVKTVISSIRAQNSNPDLNILTHDVIKRNFPNAPIITIDLEPLASIQ